MKLSRLYDRRTKIVFTKVPATGSPGTVEKLIKGGMNVVRLNLSHGMPWSVRYNESAESGDRQLEDTILQWRFQNFEARTFETW